MALRDECEKRLAKLPKPAVIQADPEAKALRDQLRNRQAEAGFLLALISFERSNTFKAGSSDREGRSRKRGTSSVRWSKSTATGP